MPSRKVKKVNIPPAAKHILSAMIDGAAVVDRLGRVVLANDAIVKVYGYSSTKDVLGKKVSDLFMSDEDFGYVVKELNERNANRFEFKTKRRDGSEFICQFKVSAISSEKEHGLHYLITAEDITHFKEVYSEIDRLSARYEAILALVPDIIMEMDESLVYTWANDAAYIFFGTEVIGRKALDYFQGEAESRTIMKPLLEGSEGVIYLESYQRRKDGAKRLLAWWYRLIWDQRGKVKGSICTARDITEAKEAEILRINSEERMRVLAHELREWIWEFNTEGLYTYSGSAVEHILGYKPEEIVGKKHFYDFFHPQDREALNDRIFKGVKEGRKIREFMSRNVHKNGEVRWLSSSGVPVHGKNDELTGYWGLTIDITERAKTDQIRDSLIRNFSHSMKTPVAMINMAHEMVRIAIENESWGMIKKAFGVSGLNLKTLNSDLDNILQAIAVQGRAPTISSVSLSEVIDENLEKFEDSIIAKKLEIEVNIAQDADTVKADLGELRTLFRNVFDNAIKFTKEGGIYVTAKISGNMVEVKVKDTGCGIAATDIGKIKQKFFRANAAVPGIGLGTSICSEIAKRIDGSFDVFSEGTGMGATVVIEIPKG